MSDERALGTLSFVQSSADGKINLWLPAVEGSYDAMTSLGRARGVELIEYMRQNEAPMVLGHVVEAMTNHGPCEIGFFHAISEYLI